MRDLPCRSPILGSTLINLFQINNGAQFDCRFSCAKDKTDEVKKWKSSSSLFPGWTDLSYIQELASYCIPYVLSIIVKQSNMWSSWSRWLWHCDCSCLQMSVPSNLLRATSLPKIQNCVISMRHWLDVEIHNYPLRSEIGFWRADPLSWGQHHQLVGMELKCTSSHGCNLSCWRRQINSTNWSFESLLSAGSKYYQVIFCCSCSGCFVTSNMLGRQTGAPQLRIGDVINVWFAE